MNKQSTQRPPTFYGNRRIWRARWKASTSGRTFKQWCAVQLNLPIKVLNFKNEEGKTIRKEYVWPKVNAPWNMTPIPPRAYANFKDPVTLEFNEPKETTDV